MIEQDTAIESPAALAGIRVVDASTLLAGPMAAMFLGDFGADVVKVEHPTKGDNMRSWGHMKDGVPLYWKVLARNKRPITLDLHHPEGQELFKRLVGTADILVENFRPGTLERWGIGWDDLRDANPGLIMIRMTGFGQTGPYAPRPGFGTLAEAMSGFAYINGWPDGPPTLPPFGLADAIAGITAAFGALAALRHRVTTGAGQVIDVALYEPLFTVLGSIAVDYDQCGIVQERTGNRAPFASPRNAYQTHDDKWIVLSASSQNVAARVLEAIGRPELIDDPRFRDNRARVENVAALDDLIAPWVRARSRAEALREFEAHQVAAGPVFDVADIFADVHVRARQTLIELQDEELGSLRMQRPVPLLMETPGQVRWSGQKQGVANDEVYGDLLGLSPEERAGLAAKGVI